jgi:hypothetical protein
MQNKDKAYIKALEMAVLRFPLPKKKMFIYSHLINSAFMLWAGNAISVGSLLRIVRKIHKLFEPQNAKKL